MQQITTGGVSFGPGKSSPTSQDQAHLALKQGYRVSTTQTDTGRTPIYLASAPQPTYSASALLDPSIANSVQEPAGSGKDDAGNEYNDPNMYNLCGPGATTVALSYWFNTAKLGQRTFNDYVATTTWNDSWHHAYIMYLATQIKWPGQNGVPGEISYSNGRSTGTNVGDLVNALNWAMYETRLPNPHPREAEPTPYAWPNGFYSIESNPGQDQIRNDIVQDIAWAKVPAIALVNGPDLTNNDWRGQKGQRIGHFIAIIGYDNLANTYTYEETYGNLNQTYGFGMKTISQNGLWTAMTNIVNPPILIW